MSLTVVVRTSRVKVLLLHRSHDAGNCGSSPCMSTLLLELPPLRRMCCSTCAAQASPASPAAGLLQQQQQQLQAAG